MVNYKHLITSSFRIHSQSPLGYDWFENSKLFDVDFCATRKSFNSAPANHRKFWCPRQNKRRHWSLFLASSTTHGTRSAPTVSASLQSGPPRPSVSSYASNAAGSIDHSERTFLLSGAARSTRGPWRRPGWWRPSEIASGTCIGRPGCHQTSIGRGILTARWWRASSRRNIRSKNMPTMALRHTSSTGTCWRGRCHRRRARRVDTVNRTDQGQWGLRRHTKTRKIQPPPSSLKEPSSSRRNHKMRPVEKG